MSDTDPEGGGGGGDGVFRRVIGIDELEETAGDDFDEDVFVAVLIEDLASFVNALTGELLVRYFAVISRGDLGSGFEIFPFGRKAIDDRFSFPGVDSSVKYHIHLGIHVGGFHLLDAGQKPAAVDDAAAIGGPDKYHDNGKELKRQPFLKVGDDQHADHDHSADREGIVELIIGIINRQPVDHDCGGNRDAGNNDDLHERQNKNDALILFLFRRNGLLFRFLWYGRGRRL